MCCSCVLVSSPAFNNTSSTQQTEEQQDQAHPPVDIYKKSIGYLMTIASVTISGFVSIYFEKVVKSKEEMITIWERNFQLCFYSIVFCFVMNMYTTAQNSANSEPYTPPLAKWSSLTLVVAVLGAGNGLIVAATLKYADSILKVLAQAGGIIISTGLGYMFQGEPLDIFVVVGCLVAILSIMNYTFDTTLQPSSSQEGGAACTVVAKKREHERNDEKDRLLPEGTKV